MIVRRKSLNREFETIPGYQTIDDWETYCSRCFICFNRIRSTRAVFSRVLSVSNQSHQFEFSQSCTLIGSNVWTPVPEFVPAVLAVTMVALTTCAAAIAYRRKVNPQHAQIQYIEQTFRTYQKRFWK